MKGSIQLSKINKEGVVIEEAKEFEQSPFRYVYQKAGFILEDIISKCSEESPDLLPVYNVISFEGRRGTGKTSAMLSIKNALENEKSLLFENLQSVDKKRAIYFDVLDYIDASRLETVDDILQIVLANMFTNVREKSRKGGADDYRCRELYQLFDEIYGCILDERRSLSEQIGYSPIQALTQLSNSQIIGKRIRKLVKRYLAYMRGEDCGQNNTDSYLVITIDDIDMHYKEEKVTPYDMLEKLHRYLMLPNVIILLSYNYRELEGGCERHFKQILKSEVMAEQKDMSVYIQKLIVDYLNKVVPMYARLHMPSVRKKDYSLNHSLEICIDNNVAEKLLGDNLCNYRHNNSEREIYVPAKEFIFLLKANVAELYYDAVGSQRHFAEASSIRKLTQMYSFYRQLKKIKDVEGEEGVFKNLLDDLYFRFANEVLVYKELEQFQKYLDISIEKRNRYILRDICEILKKEYADPKEFYTNGVCEKFRETYEGNVPDLEENPLSLRSYGMLLYGLKQVSQSGAFRKELVWCILDSYTIMLTKLCAELKGNENQKKAEARRILKEVIGDSIAGGWVNAIMPKLSFISVNHIKGDYIIPDSSTKKYVSEIVYESTNVKWMYNLTNLSDVNEQKKQLQILEILCMFFTNVYYDPSIDEVKQGFKVVYHPVGDVYEMINERDRQKDFFEISFTAGCFNIMNFVVNLMFAEEFFANFRSCFNKAYVEYLRYIGYGEKDISNFWENSSLEKTNVWKKWSRYSDGFAMPVYSFDMMYNIFKRANQKKIYTDVANYDQYWNNLKRFYDDIGELLSAEDKFYFPKEEKCREGKFYKAYSRCPFIDYINKVQKYSSEKSNLFEAEIAENDIIYPTEEEFAGSFINMLKSICNA